jgi:hypothetical protein
MGFLTPRAARLGLLLLALAACLAPAGAEAAIVKQVTSGTQTMPASTTATQISLPSGTDITKSFVVCSTRTTQTTADIYMISCDLNTSGGSPRLTITPGATAPAASSTFVSYYVVEFTAGVSVQRGSATFSGTSLTPTSAVTLSTAVDCAKSFVLTSVRDNDSSNSRDEVWTIRAFLATGSAACTSGTTTSLDLSRNVGRSGTTVSVNWQVVTYEGASVQRGIGVCIGAAATCPANGGTAGTNTRVTLGTAVDTTKSFILLTRKGGSATGGVEALYNVRGEWVSTGSSVTGLNFARSINNTTANQQVDFAWEVVSLSDGSTVQTSGASPTSVATASASATASLTTSIDTTRTVAFLSFSGGDSGSSNRFDDTSVTGVLSGSNGTNPTVTFARGTSGSVGVSVGWFAVSFFRCSTASGVAHDTLCTVGSTINGTAATVNWSSVNNVVIVGSTTNSFTTPTDGTSPAVGTFVGSAQVVYNGTTATTTSYSTTAPAGTSYYKIWAKATATGTCTTSPCYIGGVSGSVTTTSAPTTWASIVIGGAALNPAVAGTLSGAGRMSIGSNGGRLITYDSTSGAWDSVPAATVGAVQGYLSLFPYSSTEMLVGGDQSGWVYSIDPSTGSYNWIVQLSADAIQAAVTTFLRSGFSAAMTSAYPGTYDIIFVATKNNQASGGYLNNKVYALRSDTGATLWTFWPQNLSVSPCASGCPMDQVLGQPWVDYDRGRLYVTSRFGSGAGGQNSIWIIDVINNGTLLAKFASGDITTAPTVTYDETKLLVGNEAGSLRIIDLNALTETSNSIAAGSAFKGFIWEDFNTQGKIFFVTTDGNVWCLPSPSSGSQCWTKVKPVASGTVNQMMLGDTYLWVGGSNGTLYQLTAATGAISKSYAVGSGLSLGPVSTETTNELYVAASDGTLYKIALTSGSLP